MELKVWVDGIQRIVCGVNEATTCQDVVYALAHATGQTGRFILVERWRNNERTLSPQDRPLKVLSKWGEYASDVQFILRRSNALSSKTSNSHGKDPLQNNTRSFSPTPPHVVPGSVENNGAMVSKSSASSREAIKKSLTFSGSHQLADGTVPHKDSEKCGLDIRGSLFDNSREESVPLLRDDTTQWNKHHPHSQVTSRPIPEFHRNDADTVQTVASPSPSFIASTAGSKLSSPRDTPSPASDVASSRFASPASNKINYYPSSPNYHQPPPTVSPSKHPSHPSSSSNPPGPPRPRPADGPPPYPGNSQKVLVGTLSPPPYRSPPTTKIQRPHPPPVNQSSPRQKGEQPSAVHENKLSSDNSVRSEVSDDSGFSNDSNKYNNYNRGGNNKTTTPEKSKSDSRLKGNQEVVKVVYDSRYRDLIRLVNYQRETLGNQQAQLTQYDAEIVYWEEKHREHSRQAELIESEIKRLEAANQEADEEVTRLDQMHLDDDFELGHQQERTLRSEITLLRSKLSNCETELLQCKNKIRLLLDEGMDERRQVNRESEERRERERNLLNEIEDLQLHLKVTVEEYEAKVSVKSSETLIDEIHEIEAAISKKKRDVDELVREIKEANLESLLIAPSDDVKHLDGAMVNRPGSTRKIVGSPRQLENAVPTNKNPHGVWV